MDYIRIQSIEDPLFAQMHRMMQTIFPGEEVLAFDLWAEPLADEGLRVYVAVHEGEVVGATEYRYVPDLKVAMTDFTIIGREQLGVGPFLARRRREDLLRWVAAGQGELIGMFAEIYNPYVAGDHEFGGVKAMNPFVRREVLAHLGYRRLDFAYVHPSWNNDGEAVSGLDLCFLSEDPEQASLPASLVHRFLSWYYAILPNKPESWTAMMDGLSQRGELKLLPL